MNGYLTFRDGVKTTPEILRSVEALAPFFDGESSEVTSGLRTERDQLGIIMGKLGRHGFDTEFDEFKANIDADIEHKVEINGETYYWWQRSWSRLLSIGDIVNPPVPAIVLFDYFRPGSTTNKKGETIGLSPHQKGLAYDIGGGKNLLEKYKRVMQANQVGKAFITDYLCERVNNAVHIGCRKIEA